MRNALAVFVASLFAASGVSADVIHSCVNLAGKVRIVDGPGKCKFLERHLSWNEQGPSGTPGMDGVDGMDGEPGPPGPGGGGEPRFELVGFSSTHHRGDSGVLAFTAACQSDFPGSRMCESTEIIKTITVPTLPTATHAWVQPSFVPRADASADVSGEEASTHSDLTCDGWDFAGNSVLDGLTVSEIGGFENRRCDLERPVACCAPVE